MNNRTIMMHARKREFAKLTLSQLEIAAFRAFPSSPFQLEIRREIGVRRTKERLEYLRGELRAERISYGELAELQGLREHIEPHDVELLEAAGVAEGGAS